MSSLRRHGYQGPRRRNSYGKHKVLFGTNFPQLALRRCADQARAIELRPDARAAFLHENARRVFRLGVDRTSA